MSRLQAQDQQRREITMLLQALAVQTQASFAEHEVKLGQQRDNSGASPGPPAPKGL